MVFLRGGSEVVVTGSGGMVTAAPGIRGGFFPEGRPAVCGAVFFSFFFSSSSSHEMSTSMVFLGGGGGFAIRLYVRTRARSAPG
jgi:hypothetical protein